MEAILKWFTFLEFLEKFSLKVAAEQSHACNENFRSLRYLEMHCLKHKESIEESASLLLVNWVFLRIESISQYLLYSQQIHSQLQNSDFVHGISSIQKGATARYEQLLLYEMNGQSQVNSKFIKKKKIFNVTLIFIFRNQSFGMRKC